MQYIARYYIFDCGDGDEQRQFHIKEYIKEFNVSSSLKSDINKI